MEEMAAKMPTGNMKEMVMVLEQAALAAKQLPTTTDSSQLIRIYSALHSAHHDLSTFLLSHPSFPHPPPRPPPSPPHAAEISVASATGGDDNDDADPMQVVDGGEADEMDSKQVDRVEERLREFFIQNKRPKRPLPPSAAAAAEQPHSSGVDLLKASSIASEFDPHGTRLRLLDLIYQFHA